MPKIYWMTGYNIKPGKHGAYKTLLKSKGFKKMCADVEKETGMRYVETYMAIIPSSSEEGDYEAYDFWELPNHAAMDKIRGSSAMPKLMESFHDLVEPRPTKSIVLRRASDTKILFEPKK